MTNHLPQSSPVQALQVYISIFMLHSPMTQEITVIVVHGHERLRVRKIEDLISLNKQPRDAEMRECLAVSLEILL